MRRRAVRFTLLALLLIIGAAAGSVAWNTDSQRRALAINNDEVTDRLDRIISAISDIGAAQQAYVAPGQSAPAAFEQTAAQIQRIATELETVQPMLRSAEAAELSMVIRDGAAALLETDSSARGHLRTDQVLWAAEVVFGQARDTRATITQAVKALQAAESRALQTAQERLAQLLLVLIGGAAAIWTLGLIALTWVPRTKPTAAPLTISEPAPAPAPAESAPLTAPISRLVDLTSASGVCTDISRLASGEALAGVLARAAAVLDASGIILWMGAGGELFAAAAHGYDARVVARLGTIAMSADNATAVAWRSGRVGVVAGDAGANGAIVAPMFGPEGCVGVLATEVRHGRESDEDTRAVAAIIASQLATVLSAWPGPSTGALREASGL